MASTLTYGYGGSPAGMPPVLGDQFSTSNRFPQYQYSSDVSPAGSPLIRDFSVYEKIIPSSRVYSRSEQHATEAILAAQEAAELYDTHRKSRRPSTGNKRRSVDRPRTQPRSSVSDSSLSRSLPRTAGTKDRFRSNLRRIAQQKEDDTTTIDLSKTAEENEKISGIHMYSQRPGSQSVTDVRFAPTLPRRRNYTLATVTNLEPFKPSAPFMRPGLPTSRPGTPGTATHSFEHSVINSEYSDGDAYASYRPSMQTSRRPSLRVTTEGEGSSGSLRSFNGPRRSTNGSSSAVTPTGTKSRKSFDKAFSLLSRRDSSGTVNPMNESSRVASIQAARQAFDKRQEEKDAKYEKRAVKHRNRQEKKERRRSITQERNPSFVSSKGNQAHVLNEKMYELMQGREYSTLPVRRVSSKPDNDRVNMSTTRRAKSGYAAFLSWLKTKILNIGRRSRKL